MVVIETGRLILRQFDPGDLEDLAAIYADPEVMTFTGGVQNRAQTQERLQRMLRLYAEKGFGLWATVLKPEMKLIGRCGLIPWSIGAGEEIEVGYLLAKNYWGRGLGTEAAAGIVQHAFDTLKLRRLISLIRSANRASFKVAGKAGLKFEKHVLFNGNLVELHSLER